jgi:hypothetical protein
MTMGWTGCLLVGGFALGWLDGGFVIGLTGPSDPQTAGTLISGLPLSAVYVPSAPISKLWLFPIGPLVVGGCVGGCVGGLVGILVGGC